MAHQDTQEYTSAQARKEAWLPLMQELVRCYQAFSRHSARHIKTLGLTPSQFDVIATLGNTEGMNFKTLGQETLITKGTLTGIIDRLEAKGLVRRVSSGQDRRSTLIQLTEQGQKLFEKVFPEHIRYLSASFGHLDSEQQSQLRRLLRGLRNHF